MKALNLDPGEQIIFEVRKHWFVFFVTGLAVAVAAIIPFVLYEVIFRFLKSAIVFTEEISALFWLLYALWLLLLWIIFFIQWTNYYLDVWYITGKRIIDVEQKGLFHREVSSLRFDKIQDITIEVRGILATILNYGDLHVQTASEDSSDFFMQSAENPEGVRKIIFAHHNIAAERPAAVKIVPHDGAP
ncbi:PH domain-containing protein [Patescibacteria group bacterium]|nr:MAG: PH domain-containing protein [Patescibacteria group bacterium]